MTNSTYQERLSEILRQFRSMELTLSGVTNKDNSDPRTWGLTLGEAREAITSLMLDVIGKDEEGENFVPDVEAAFRHERNKLRDELRQTIKGDK